jgi:lysyl-tRNA synthetase class 2
VRSFFEKRGVLEVDCNALRSASPIDEHIDVMQVHTGSGTGYLHTSPEYGMKELLSLGSGDIYQLSHVFRAGEIGPWHTPEFTMLEWYRLGFSFEEMIQETIDCILLFLPSLAVQKMSYIELFHNYLGCDYRITTTENLQALLAKEGITLSNTAWDKETLLQLTLSHLIEPKLGKDHLFVLTHFPASQAALSKIVGESCLRFEVYYQGIELANGYVELTDPIEQKKRLLCAEEKRRAAGKSPLPIDESFLAALERGLPECAGVAVGFDRLISISAR